MQVIGKAVTRNGIMLTSMPKKVVAHREGRTRSLQITLDNPPKSLTLYPIELGGH